MGEEGGSCRTRLPSLSSCVGGWEEGQLRARGATGSGQPPGGGFQSKLLQSNAAAGTAPARCASSVESSCISPRTGGNCALVILPVVCINWDNGYFKKSFTNML